MPFNNSTRKQFNNCDSGFTLIELLVVFSIIGLLSGLGFAAFTNYSHKQAVDQAVQDLKTAIDTAKFDAVSKVKPTACTGVLIKYNFVLCSKSPSNCVDAVNHDYEVNAICSTVPTTVTLLSKKLSSSLSIPSYGSCGTLTYNTLTGFESPGYFCDINLTGYGITKSVSVDMGGNPAVQ